VVGGGGGGTKKFKFNTWNPRIRMRSVLVPGNKLCRLLYTGFVYVKKLRPEDKSMWKWIICNKPEKGICNKPEKGI
jgi:hypothetical protein